MVIALCETRPPRHGCSLARGPSQRILDAPLLQHAHDRGFGLVEDSSRPPGVKSPSHHTPKAPEIPVAAEAGRSPSAPQLRGSRVDDHGRHHDLSRLGSDACFFGFQGKVGRLASERIGSPGTIRHHTASGIPGERTKKTTQGIFRLVSDLVEDLE